MKKIIFCALLALLFAWLGNTIISEKNNLAKGDYITNVKIAAVGPFKPRVK